MEACPARLLFLVTSPLAAIILAGGPTLSAGGFFLPRSVFFSRVVVGRGGEMLSGTRGGGLAVGWSNI